MSSDHGNRFCAMSSAVLKTSEARSRWRNAIPVLQSSGEANWFEPHGTMRSLCGLRSTSLPAVCTFGLPHRKSTASCHANRLRFISSPPFGKGCELQRLKPYATVHCPPNNDSAIEMIRLRKHYKPCFTVAVVLARTCVHRPWFSGGHLDPRRRKVSGSNLSRPLSTAYSASSARGNSMSRLRLVVKFRCFRVTIARQTARAFSR